MLDLIHTGEAQELRDIFPEKCKNGKERHAFYSSPESFAAHIEGLNLSNNWADCGQGEGGGDKYGSHTLKDAIGMARKGWPEGARRVDRMRERIAAARPQSQRLAKWSVAGAYPSVGRYLAGDPLNMRALDMATSRRRPVITLLSDMSVSWNIKGEAITNRAGVAAALVDSIEAAGFSCEVIAYAYNESFDGRTASCIACITKEAGAAADAGRLAFGLGHAAMFRRLMFVSMCEDKHISGLTSTLGKPCTIPAKNLAARNIFVIPSANHNEAAFKNESIAETAGLEYCIADLRKQGCPAFPQDESAVA